MGGAPYVGPRLGGGPIFKGSVSPHLDAKERPVNFLIYSCYLHNLNSSSGYH